MENMEDKLGAILGNPEMMQKIMAMAQSFGTSPAPGPTPPEPTVNSMPLPNIDLDTIQKISGFMSKTSVDREQQALLSALMPYLNKTRIQKLENAMRASKLAGVVALALRQQSHNFL